MTAVYPLSSTPMGQPGTAGIAGSRAGLSSEAIAWAASRGIGQRTLEILNVGSATVFFPDARTKLPALIFRYDEPHRKARSFPDKHFITNKGFEGSFWNLENVLLGPLDWVYIVEGEMDALALVEAGIQVSSVISVPSGAKEKPADALKQVRGYDWVDQALKRGLWRSNRFVWCGDADEPGVALRTDMVRVLGAAKFWSVEWPEGIKDANEMLVKEGPKALLDLVTNGQVQWPVEGIYRISEMPEPEPLTLWSPGFPQWESKVKLAPRTLSVVTGHPGHGKTMLWQQIWFQVMREYDVKACMASFETRAKPHIRRQIRSLMFRKLEMNLTVEEIQEADNWINDHYLFLSHSEQRPTLEWFLDLAEIAIVRHQVKIIQLDPWNRLEGARERDETETEYIGRCLKVLHSFAHDMNCHVQILAHPAKMDSNRRGNPPILEDISGSKNWDNMVDQGFVIHRPEMQEGSDRRTEATFYHRKARFDELGYPCKLLMNYNLIERRFVSVDYAGR